MDESFRKSGKRFFLLLGRREYIFKKLIDTNRSGVLRKKLITVILFVNRTVL